MPAKKKRPAAKPVKGRAKATAKKIAKKKPKAKAAKSAAKPKARAASKPAKRIAVAKPAPKRKAAAKPHTPEFDPAVDRFMAGFAHPMKGEVQAVRQLILEMNSEIAEGIKWNAPSFLTSDHFATFNFFAPKGFRLVLHLGAQMRDPSAPKVKINDPTGMIVWQGKDRGVITFLDAADAQAKRAVLPALLAQWIAQLPE